MRSSTACLPSSMHAHVHTRVHTTRVRGRVSDAALPLVVKAEVRELLPIVASFLLTTWSTSAHDLPVLSIKMTDRVEHNRTHAHTHACAHAFTHALTQARTRACASMWRRRARARAARDGCPHCTHDVHMHVIHAGLHPGPPARPSATLHTRSLAHFHTFMHACMRART